MDLTAFVGKTIQVVWYYQGIDVGSTPSGWLVDDVTITGVAGGGTTVITKNLGQGTFTLNGIIGQSGTAPSTTITNAASKLVFLSATLLTNNLVQLEWAAIPGRLYQVQTSSLDSTNLQAWTPMTDWLQALSSPMYYSAASTNQSARVYRVQVRP